MRSGDEDGYASQPRTSAEIQLRSSKRFAAGELLEVRCESWAQFVKSYSKDISSGGLFIQTGTPPPLYSDLEIKIHLPEGSSLHLTARVVHLITPERAASEGGKPGVGVQFLDLDERRRRHIRALVELARTRAEQHEPGPSRPTPEKPVPATPPDASRPPKKRAGGVERPKENKEEQDLLHQLRAELAGVKERDDLAILGLSSGSPGAPDPQAAKEAFYRLSKRFHPDLYGRYNNPEISRLATEIFILMKRAFTRLSQTKKWPTSPSASTPKVSPPAPPPPARSKRPTGDRPASRRQRPTASMGTAQRSGGRELTDRSLSRALQHIARERYPEAKQALEQVLSEQPGHTEARTWLCLVQARQLLASGDEEEALAMYEAVLRLDERNLEAVKAVREIYEARRSRQRSERRPKET